MLFLHSHVMRTGFENFNWELLPDSFFSLILLRQREKVICHVFFSSLRTSDNRVKKLVVTL